MKILHNLIKFRIHIMITLIALTLAFTSVCIYNHKYDRICKIINSSNEDLTVEGKITSFPERHDDGKISFSIRITDCSSTSLLNTGVFVSVKESDIMPEKGDKVQFCGALILAESVGNEGGFDYKNYMKSLDVAALCYADNAEFEKVDSPLKPIYKIRSNFNESCDRYILKASSGLTKAIITGDRGGILPKDESAFKSAGIYHIVAISGLHLNIFMCAIFFFISKLKMKRAKKAIISLIASGFVGLFVLIFTGFGVSVIRAFIMMIILGAAAVVPRDYNAKNALFVSGFVIVILMPYCAYSVAMWLSLLSTLGVLFGIDIISHFKSAYKLPLLTDNYVGNTIVISAMTTLTTLPITSIAFGYVPLYSWIANSAVLPVMGFFMALGIFFAFATSLLPGVVAQIFGYALSAMGKYVIKIAHIVESLPMSTINIYPQALLWTGFLLLFAVAGIYIVRKSSLKTLIVASLIFVIAGVGFLVYNVSDEGIEITFVDVGQGDCAIIQCDGSDFMIDCGSQNEQDYIASTVESVLRHKNIRKLDAVIVSHYHKDHVNGLCDIIEKGKVKNLLLPKNYDITEREARENYEKLLESCAKSATKITYVQKGDSITTKNGLTMDIIYPANDVFLGNNNMSMVTKVRYGDFSAMFYGDCEEEALENCLVQDVECNVIKIPHHGAQNALADVLAQKSGAEVAIASCSKYNIYGHPAPETVESFEKSGCKVYKTFESGAIKIKADKNGKMTIDTMR